MLAYSPWILDESYNGEASSILHSHFCSDQTRRTILVSNICLHKVYMTTRIRFFPDNYMILMFGEKYW